ncbi:MAG: hypothetical protein JWO90_1161 [Solirubrobacterales bacterium]|nr:hypothetical protein [Solirubrobacterales bacterium]
MDPTPRRRPPARPSAQTFLRRRLGAATVLLVGGFLLIRLASALLGGDGDGTSAAAGTASGAALTEEPTRPEATELPGGGRRIFPDRRVVALYGNPADDELGALGIGTPDQAAKRLRGIARSYARRTRPVLPCMELIATVAAAAPGDDGKYRIRVPERTIDRYLRAARKAGAVLLLDIQPGIASFPEEVRRLKKWLVQPDVGLALDPEWRIQPGQVPGRVIGSVSAEEVNAVSIDLAALVKERNLPEKLFVIHQFTNDMVRDKQRVEIRPGLATVFNVDGFGLPAAKVSKYRDFTASTPKGAHDGFKLFFREDTNRMRPAAVMALDPRPDLVIYE